MPIYRYRAKNKEGETEKGMVEAIDINIAADILSDRDLFILDIKQKSRIGKIKEYISGLFSGIKVSDTVIMLQQLSVLISANISIVDALKILEGQTKNKTLKKVILEVADDVEGGGKLSDSFGRHGKIFDDFFVNMVKSGETSGKLDEILNYLAKQKEADWELNKKIKGAMIYPAFIITGLLVVAVVMMIYVVPKLTDVLTESGQELPLSTRMLMSTSDFFQNFWWLTILIITGVVVLVRIYKKTQEGQRNINKLLFRVPVLGNLMKKVYLVRFTRSFTTLVQGGVNITNSLDISADVVGNIIYKDIIKKTVKEVEDGNSISSVFYKSSYIPPMLSQMMAIGEETGRITEILEKVTSFYEREVQDLVKNLVTLLEPMVMVVMGIGVGILVSAILLPMYNMSQAI